MRRQICLQPIACCALVLAGAAFVGCTALKPPPLYTPENAMPIVQGAVVDGTAPMDAPRADEFEIQMATKSQFGRPQTKAHKMPAGATVQTALAQAKLPQRFRDMQVRVYRVTPQSRGEAVPMEADYVRRIRGIDPMKDFLLYPGDKIVVNEIVSSGLDDLFNAIGMGRH